MQSESTQLISRFMSRDLQWSMKLKLLMDTFWHQEVRQPQSAVATRQQRCAWSQKWDKNTSRVYTHTFKSCFIKKKSRKTRSQDWFEDFGPGYPRRHSSIACSSCSSWHWGPKWRQRRRLTLEMTERAGPLAPLAEERRAVISLNDDSLSHFRRP